MTKLSEMISNDEVHARDMEDPEYRSEWERTTLAAAVALHVLKYREQHELSQTKLGELLAMSQPQVARIERGDHTPSLATLARLCVVLDTEFNIDIRPSGRPAKLTNEKARKNASLTSFAEANADIVLSVA